MNGSGENDYTIGSVQRALKILKLFVPANDALTLMDISKQTGLHKSTALRMVATLKEEGFLKQSSESKKYRLGIAALQMGLSSLDSLSLSKVSEPILRELADKTGFAVHLGIFESGNVIVLAKVFPVDKTFSIRLMSKIGGVLPTYCTGIGLLFLAHESPAFVREYLSKCEIIRYTSNTETNIERIIQRVDAIREQGFTVNNGEHEEGVVSVCYPIYDHTRRIAAAMSVGGIREVLARCDMEQLKERARRAAMDISRELGYYT